MLAHEDGRDARDSDGSRNAAFEMCKVVHGGRICHFLRLQYEKLNMRHRLFPEFPLTFGLFVYAVCAGRWRVRPSRRSGSPTLGAPPNMTSKDSLSFPPSPPFCMRLAVVESPISCFSRSPSLLSSLPPHERGGATSLGAWYVLESGRWTDRGRIADA